MRFLQRQTDSLRENNFLMRQSQQVVDSLRKSLHENYRVIDSLLIEWKISKAMAYIRRQNNRASVNVLARSFMRKVVHENGFDFPFFALTYRD